MEGYEQLLDRLDKIIELLSAKNGSVSITTKDKVFETLVDRKRLNTQEVGQIAGISHATALDVMKELGQKENTLYRQGRGNTPSIVVYDDSEHGKYAMKLAKTMPKGTSWGMETVAKTLNIDEQDARDTAVYCKKIDPNEFLFNAGSFIRRR